ncbi:hypothetical protein [Micromonospora costi]|uniref:Uncharacterized protein n=1 Tax=Micromonospora costi TaxID=1530042 RepID=A0A3B0A6G3_9ACTN|nr:hypothetical protein [Micromonospora costi]RKN55973.1 hypothetical protein D7193_15420 [Micromonospora costi]
MLPPSVSLTLFLFWAELGDVATWIGALANAATLGLALAAGIVSYNIYKIESGRDRRAEDERRERAFDARRDQASLVSAWFDKRAVSSVVIASSDGVKRIPNNTAGARILNASNLPIYDVRVSFRLFPAMLRLGDPIRAVPPHKGEVVSRLPDEMWQLLPEGDVELLVDVALEFRDAAGRCWKRDFDGFLSEAPTLISELFAILDRSTPVERG